MRRILKTAILPGEMLFLESDPEVVRVRPDFARTYLDIVTTDASGAPVTPSTGTYTVYAKTADDDMGFQTLQDQGTVQAITTGGSSMPDGQGVQSSFSGNPVAVKVVPSGVDVGVGYKVVITQYR